MRIIIENQYFNLNTFLEEIEVLVIMVAHDEIKENAKKLGARVAQLALKLSD